MTVPESALTAQQVALQTLRARYERGEVTYDTFRDTFNALLKAQTPEACQQILAELPILPQTVLDALERHPAPVRTRARGTRWLVMALGEMQRTRRPWRLGHRTVGLMGLGEMTLDLSLAALPQRGNLTVFGGIGEVTIKVPHNLPVVVRTFTLLGEANALGEITSGIFAHASEESGDVDSNEGVFAINVFLLIGEVTVLATAISASATVVPGTAPQTALPDEKRS